MTPSSISVVVPTWLRPTWLALCIEGLLAQTVLPREIVVVGRSDDVASLEVVRQATQQSSLVRWATVDRAGHLPPIEVGIAEARGDLVAFIDDDAVPHVSWLATLQPHFADASIACVGGRMYEPDFRGRVRSDAGVIRWYGRHVGNLKARESPRVLDVPAVVECNWMWRRDVLAAVGVDPALGGGDSVHYGLEMCLHAKALGYRVVYDSQAVVTHYLAPRDVSLSRDNAVDHSYTYSRHYTYVALKYFPLRTLFFFAVWSALIGERNMYGLVKAIADGLRDRDAFRRWRVSLRGRLDGFLDWRRRRHNFHLARRSL